MEMKMTQVMLWICLLASAPIAAQSNEGRIRYLISHSWAKKMTAIDYISQQRKDEVAYMWGKEEWQTYAELWYNASASLYFDSDEKVNTEEMGYYSWRKDVYSIRRDFVRDSLLDEIDFLGKTYVIEDRIHFPNWKIGNDLKEVAGHLCMNASWYDTLKLQQVNAWFALDLPVSAGPERFGGLPGIILEVDVNDGAMTIIADLIEHKPAAEKLKLPTRKIRGKRINEPQYAALIRAHIQEKRKAEEPYFWGIRY